MNRYFVYICLFYISKFEGVIAQDQCKDEWIGDGECDEQNNFPDISCGPYDGGDCGPLTDLFGDGKCDEQNNWPRWENYPNDYEKGLTDKNGFELNMTKESDGGDCTCESSELHRELFSLESYEEGEKTIYPNISERVCNYMNCTIGTRREFWPGCDFGTEVEGAPYNLTELLLLYAPGATDFRGTVHEIFCSYDEVQ